MVVLNFYDVGYLDVVLYVVCLSDFGNGLFLWGGGGLLQVVVGIW